MIAAYLFGEWRHSNEQSQEKHAFITGAQLWILQEIAKTNSIGISELATRLSRHQSICSLLVEKLVETGMLKKVRSKEDQRRVVLYSTDKSLMLLQKAPGPAEGILPEALQALSEPTLHNLDQSLKKLIGQLRVDDNSQADRPLFDL